MTFDEYFETKYGKPENASLTLAIRGIAQDAWEAAYQAGYDDAKLEAAEDAAGEDL